MSTVPRLLKWTVSALMVLLVAIAVVGSAPNGHAYLGVGLGVLFLTLYFGGAAYAMSAHENERLAGRKQLGHRVAAIWLLTLTAIWAGLLAISDSALWLAFPLILLQVGVLGTTWGGLAALLTSLGTAAVSVYRLPADTQPFGALFGPLLGGVVAGTFMWGVMAIARESRARKSALEELQTARIRLAQAEEDSVVIAERQRLAGELHDTVSQGLSATAMLLRAAQATDDPAVSNNLVRQSLEATEANLAEARRITSALAPRELTNSRLPNALRAVAAESADQQLDVSVQAPEDPLELPLAEEAALLRVAQSALWNVREHSGASQATVRLSLTPELVTLDIEDDGHGFQSNQGSGEDRGVGLRTMKARMHAVGGELTVTTSATGTHVRATLPHRVWKPNTRES